MNRKQLLSSTEPTPANMRSYLNMPLPDDVTANISGNAAREVKEIAVKWLDLFHSRENVFVLSVVERIKITEVSINSKKDAPERMEARVVCEIDVTEDMLNSGGTMHGGCAAILIDECSSLPLSVLDFTQGGSSDAGVSQALNVVYHAPAEMGSKLRIISTSLTLGGRTMSTRSEIWDTTNRRLVASGVHLKMHSSTAKL